MANVFINSWRKFASPLPIYVTDLLIAVILSLAALIIRLGFLAEYPNSIFHEDSGPYIYEAERLLEGRATDNGLPGRPPGYPLFLAAVLKYLTTHLLQVIALQHLLAVTGVLFLAFALRMMGASRVFAYGFFVAVAFSHRLIHYDNTIGAETLTVFLMAVALFLVCGMLLRRWNPWIVSGVLGVLSAWLLLVRTASFFLPLLFALWIAIPRAHRLDIHIRARLALALLIVLPPFLTAFAMLQWNKNHYGRAVLSREVEPVMAFAIAYSGDFTDGKFPELKRELRPIIEAGRSKLGPNGYPGGISEDGGYQWVFNIFSVIDVGRLGSQQEKDRVMSGLFWETLLTPKTLYSHLTGHVWRELRFMLFDMTPVANAAIAPPRDMLHFMRRDSKPLHIAEVPTDREPGTLIAQTIPGPLGSVLQRFSSRYIHINYHTEYKQKPGMIRFYSAISLTLLLVLLARLATMDWRRNVPRGSWRIPLNPENFAAFFTSLAWLGNALVMSTLLYALHRYSYYVLPFIALTAFFALDRIWRFVAGWSRRKSLAIWS